VAGKQPKSHLLELMIELSLSEYCVAAILLTIVFVALFSWISKFAHRNAEKRGKRQRFFCNLCLHVWQKDDGNNILPCPKCGRDCQRGQ
jgi:hypothetical protein